jgi:hypothetical protein
MSIIVADKGDRTDSVYHTYNGRLNPKYPIVLVSWVEDYVFNDALLELKDYVLLCMCEYGWDKEITYSHIWGVNTGTGYGSYRGEEWLKFDNWVKNNPPKLMLKRELLKKDVSDKVQPIEYPTIVNEIPMQTEEEFNSRPINVFQYWGRSNEERIRIHSEIWLHGYNKGFQPCDNLYYINQYLSQESGEKWISLWIPHWARIDTNNLMQINNMSKLSLSWMGSGFKCFRTGEAPTCSIMVMHSKAKEYAWSWDWNETNCILVEPNDEINGIEKALKRTDLYQVYKNGVENSKKYMLPSYINHLENLINNA